MGPIKISNKAAAQVQGMVDGARRIDEQLQVYITALGAALDVPDGWQLDINAMAFVPPPGPAPEPEAAHE